MLCIKLQNTSKFDITHYILDASRTKFSRRNVAVLQYQMINGAALSFSRKIYSAVTTVLLFVDTHISRDGASARTNAKTLIISEDFLNRRIQRHGDLSITPVSLNAPMVSRITSTIKMYDSFSHFATTHISVFLLLILFFVLFCITGNKLSGLQRTVP